MDVHCAGGGEDGGGGGGGGVVEVAEGEECEFLGVVGGVTPPVILDMGFVWNG